MSIIVAYKENNKVIVGCDSQATGGRCIYTLQNKNNFKIFKPLKNDDLIIGIVGNIRDTNLIYIEDNLIDEIAILKDEINFKYIVNKLVPKIFEIMKRNERIRVKDGIIENMESQFLIAYKNNIYTIEGNGGVIEYNDYCAIGSGKDFAIGYLNEHKDYNTKNAVTNSIKSSIKSELHVGYPIVVMETGSDVIDIIEK